MTDFLLSKLEGNQPRSIANADLARLGESRNARREERDREIAEFNTEFNRLRAEAEASFSPRPVKKRNKDGTIEIVPESEASYDKYLDWADSQIQFKDNAAFITKKAARGIVADPSTLVGAAAGGLASDRTWTEGVVEAGQNADELVRLPDNAVQRLYQAKYQRWQQQKNVDLGASKELATLESERRSAMQGRDPNPERIATIDAKIEALRNDGHSSSSWLEFASKNKIAVAGDIVQETAQEVGSYATGKAAGVVARPLAGAAKLAVPARATAATQRLAAVAEATVAKLPPNVAARTKAIATPVIETTRDSIVETAEGYAGDYEGNKASLIKEYMSQGMTETQARVKASSDAASIALSNAAWNTAAEALMANRSIERTLRGKTGRANITATAGSEAASELISNAGGGVTENIILGKDDVFEGVGDRVQQGVVAGAGAGGAIGTADKALEAVGDYQMGSLVLGDIDKEATPDVRPATTDTQQPVQETGKPAGAVTPVNPIEIVAATGAGDLTPVVASAKANVSNDPKFKNPITHKQQAEILKVLDSAEVKLANGEQLTPLELDTIQRYTGSEALDSKENTQLSKAVEDATKLRDDDLTTNYVFGPKEKGIAAKLEEAVASDNATAEQVATLESMKEIMVTGKEQFLTLQKQAQEQRDAKDWAGLAKTVKQMKDKFSAARFEKAIEAAKTTSTQTVAPTAAPKVETVPEVSLSQAEIDAARNLPAESKTETSIDDVRYLAGNQLKKTNAKNATVAQKYAIGKQLRKLNEGERAIIAKALKDNKVILVEGGRGNGKNALLDSDGKIYLNVDNLAMRNFGLSEILSAGTQAVKDVVESIGETTFDKIGRSKDIASKLRHEAKHISNADKILTQLGGDKDFASLRKDVVNTYTTVEQRKEIIELMNKPADELTDEENQKLYDFERLVTDEQGAWAAEAISMATSDPSFKKRYLKQAKKNKKYKQALAAIKAAEMVRGTKLDILNLINKGTAEVAPRESKTLEGKRERAAITAAMNLTDALIPEEFRSDDPIVASTLFDKLYGGQDMTPQALAGLGVLLEPALTSAVHESDEYYNQVVVALAKVGKISDKEAASASLRVLAEVKFLLNAAERTNGYLGTSIASILNRYNESPNKNDDVAGMLARVADLRLQFEIDKSPTKHNDPYYADLYFVMPSLIANQKAYDALVGTFLAEATRGAGVSLEEVSTDSYRAGASIAKAIRDHNTTVLKGGKFADTAVPKHANKLTPRQINIVELIKSFGAFLNERFQYSSILKENATIAPPTIDMGRGADQDEAVDFVESVFVPTEETVDMSDVDFSNIPFDESFIGDSDKEVEPDKEADKEYSEATAEEKAAIDGMEEAATPIDDVVTHSVEQADMASGRNEELTDALDKYQQFFLMMDTIGEASTGLPIAPSRVEKAQLRFARSRMRGLIARIPGMLAKASNVSVLELLPTTSMTAEEAVDAIAKVANGILRNPRMGKASLLDSIKKSAANIKKKFPRSDTAQRLEGYADNIASAKKSGNMLAYVNALAGYISNSRNIGDLEATFTTKEYYQAMAAVNVLRAVYSGKSAEDILSSLKLTVIKEDTDLAGPGAKSTDLLPLPANRAEIQQNVAKALHAAKIALAELVTRLESSPNLSLYDLGWGDLQVGEDKSLSIRDRGTGASGMVYVRMSSLDADKILNPSKYSDLNPVMAKIHKKIAPHIVAVKEGKRTVYKMPVKTDVLVSLLPKSVELNAQNLPWMLNAFFSLMPVSNKIVKTQGKADSRSVVGDYAISTSYSYVEVASDLLKFESVLTKNGKPTYVRSGEVAPNVTRGDTRTKTVKALGLAANSVLYSRSKLEEAENRKGASQKELDEARGRFIAANAKYNKLKDQLAMLSTPQYVDNSEYTSQDERDLMEEILSGYHNHSEDGTYTFTRADGTTVNITLDVAAKDRADSYFYRKGTLEAMPDTGITGRETIDWAERNKERQIKSDDSDYFKTKYYKEEEVIPADVMSEVNEMFGISGDSWMQLSRKLDQVRKDQSEIEALIAGIEAKPEAERNTLNLITNKQLRSDLIEEAIDLQRQLAPLSGELAYILSDLTLTDFTADYTSMQGYSNASQKMSVLLNRIGQKPILSQNHIKDYSRIAPMVSLIVPFDLATDDAARAEYKKQAESALNKGVILAIPQTSYLSYLSGASWAESAFTNRDDVEIVKDKGILFVRTKSSLNLPGAPTLTDVLSFKFNNAAQELKNIPSGQKGATLYHYARMKEKQASMMPSPMFKFMSKASKSLSKEQLFDSLLYSVASGKYAPGVLKRIGMSVVRDVAKAAASINGIYGVVVDGKIAMHFSPITVGDKTVHFDMKDTKWFTAEGNPIVIMRKFINATRKTAVDNFNATEAEIQLLNDSIASETNESAKALVRAKYTARLKTLNSRLVDIKAAASQLDAIEAQLDASARNAMRGYVQRLLKTDENGAPVYNPGFVDRLVEYGIPSRAEKEVDTSRYAVPEIAPPRPRFSSAVHGFDINWIIPDTTPLSFEEAKKQDPSLVYTETAEDAALISRLPEIDAAVDAELKGTEYSKSVSDYNLLMPNIRKFALDAEEVITRRRSEESKNAEVRAKWAALNNIDTTKLTPRESKSAVQKRSALKRLLARLSARFSISTLASQDVSASTIRASEAVKTSYILEAQSDAEDMANLVNDIYATSPDTAQELLQDIADGMTVSISSEMYNTMSAALEEAIFEKYGANGVTVLNRAKAMRARLHELNVSIVDTLTTTPGLDYGKATAQLISLLNDSFSEYLTRSYAAHHLKTGELWKKKIGSGLMAIVGTDDNLEYNTQESYDVADEAVSALVQSPWLFSGFEKNGDFSREAAARFLYNWMYGNQEGDNTPIASVYNTLSLEGRAGLEERKLNGPEYAPFRKMLGEVEGLGGRLVASTVTLASIHAAARSVSQLVEQGVAITTYSKQFDPEKYFVLGEAFASQFGGLFNQIAIPLYLKGQFQKALTDIPDHVVLDTLKATFGTLKAWQVLSSAGVWLASLVSQISHTARAGSIGITQGTNIKNSARTLRLMRLVAQRAAKNELLKMPEKGDPDYNDYLILASSGMLDSWASVTDIKVSLLNYSKHEQDVKKVLEGEYTEKDAVSYMSRLAKRDARVGVLSVLEYVGSMFSALELPLKIFTQLTYIDMLEKAKGKSLGREGWALAGQMAIRDIPSQANVPTVISKGTEPFGITQYAGFFHRTFAAITYAPFQNAVAMKKAGVSDKVVAAYMVGTLASMALGMKGISLALAWAINMLVEAGAPDDDEERRRWRELRAKAVELQQFNNSDGDYVALGVDDSGKVKVIDLSFITSFYNQPYVLAKSMYRHLTGAARSSFFDDVVLKQMPLGPIGDPLTNLFARDAVEAVTGQRKDPGNMDDQSITEMLKYRGLGGAITDYKKTGNPWTFAGVRAKAVDLPYEMNSLAASSVGKARGVVDAIKQDVIDNATVRYTPEMVRNRYGYVFRAVKENALMAESLAKFYAERDGIAIDSSEFEERYMPGKADAALKGIVENGAEQFVSSTYGKALNGMSDTESIRGAVGKAKQKNALITEDMIIHNLRQTQITLKDFVSPYTLKDADRVSFGRVVDGDTLYATVNGVEYEVRIDNVDTAEADTPLVDGVDYHAVAADRLKELTRGGQAGLKYRVDKDGNMVFDDYNRLLARPYVDGVDLGTQLVKERLAYGDSDEIPVYEHPAKPKDENKD